MSQTTSGNSEPGSVSPEFFRAEGFPPLGLPTVFADTVANLAPLASTVRFYFVRTEPDVSGTNRYQNVPVATVIMPIEAFAASIVFLNKSLEGLVKNQQISKE